MNQLKTWQGQFGVEYTDRNATDWQQRLPSFRRVLDGLSVQRTLEVGCNRGHNLIALTQILGADAEIIGIEPNRHACQLARGASNRVSVLDGNVFALPFKDGWFDLVFSVGVLIHIALPDLNKALFEIHRVTRRYILAIEYFAEEETEILYREQEGLLWKRNFLRHYQTQFSELKVAREGYFGPEEGFDRTHWWLLEKPQ